VVAMWDLDLTCHAFVLQVTGNLSRCDHPLAQHGGGEHARGQWERPVQAVNNILSISHTLVETGHGAGYEPWHGHQAPNC
jgi:hypothetical protein